MWTAPGSNLNWVIFDLKADHVITKVRIYCWFDFSFFFTFLLMFSCLIFELLIKGKAKKCLRNAFYKSQIVSSK